MLIKCTISIERILPSRINKQQLHNNAIKTENTYLHKRRMLLNVNKVPNSDLNAKKPQILISKSNE